jgi:hypothetical protein
MQPLRAALRDRWPRGSSFARRRRTTWRSTRRRRRGRTRCATALSLARHPRPARGTGVRGGRAPADCSGRFRALVRRPTSKENSVTQSRVISPSRSDTCRVGQWLYQSGAKESGVIWQTARGTTDCLMRGGGQTCLVDGVRLVQREGRDLDVEVPAGIRVHHLIRSTHHTRGSVQAASRRVLKGLAG